MAKRKPRIAKCPRCGEVVPKRDAPEVPKGHFVLRHVPENYHLLCYLIVVSEAELRHGPCCFVCSKYVTYPSMGGQGLCHRRLGLSNYMVGASRLPCRHFSRKADVIYREIESRKAEDVD